MDNLESLNLSGMANNSQSAGSNQPLLPSDSEIPDSQHSEEHANTPNSNQVLENFTITPQSSVPAFSFMPLFVWPFSLISSIISGLVFRTLNLFGINKSVTSGNFDGYTAAPTSSSNVITENPELINANSAVKWLVKNCEQYPPIFMGEYSSALATARRAFKYLLIILISEIQDNSNDLLEILREKELIDYINSNNVIFWMGSVLESSGMQVAETLTSGKLPLFALAAPKFDPESNSFRLSIVARMDGIPETATAEAVKSRFLTNWMQTPISRYNNIIQSARNEQEERNRARELRLQQDAAYEASLTRDRIREDNLRIEKEEQKKRELRRQEKRIARENLAKNRQQWRLNVFQKYFDRPEPTGTPSDGVCTLSIRLSNGARIKRKFCGDDPLERIYMFIDTYDLFENKNSQSNQGKQLMPSASLEKDNTKDSDNIATQIDGYVHNYDFKVITAFPKIEISPSTESIRVFLEEQKLWPNVALIVDPLDSDELLTSEEE
ncbi:hypothetical protein BB560_006221 [Smittium megazygosporum]|uniref:UBX domain-containing protein n=1 Tax=Smittium megazygosporum TaxID=133381 RepID=A0A2T9YD75_9FUNG|nr:hypothetical protein BB560_006221 [Smittium megazygosporum]